MNREIKEAQYFLNSQAFADGLRTTIAILLPALIGFQNGYKTVGLAISMGALCVSLTDAPGPGMHKRNGMLFCSLFIFIVAYITGLAKSSVWLMGLEIAVVCFVFSMFSVFGNRSTSVGNAVILVMILTMDDPTIADNIGFHSVLIMVGGLWYMIISIMATIFRPYRLAQRVLGDSIRELAKYLRIKGKFYEPSTDLAENYRELVAQQILVHENQDATREVLFKTRATVKESTPMGRKLVMTFVESVDFFEDTTATFYDYNELRSKFGDTGVLEKIGDFLALLSAEIENMGLSIQMKSKYKALYDLESALVILKQEIDKSGQGDKSNLVLKKILVNLRNLVQRLEAMKKYFDKDVKKKSSPLDHSHFVSHHPMGGEVLLNNLSLDSSAFRHSLRVSIACLIGFLTVRWIDYGQHSYWILLTIAFIIKPAFSLTKQRNKERLIGTLIGVGVGSLILLLISNTTTLFVIMVIFMISTYSFLRTNYLAMVLSVTPFVIILFNFLGMGFMEVAKERVLDTLIGCLIALPVSYFLFPNWESEQLKNHILNVLKANAAYLDKLVKSLRGEKIDILDYKLARKEVYVHSANLTALFHRMLSEPRSKQKNSNKVHEFVVMNNIFFSNIATISTSLIKKESQLHYKPLINSAQRALHKLNESLSNIDPSFSGGSEMPGKKEWVDENPSQDDLFLKDQLDYLCKLADDMKKTTKILGS